MQSAAVSCVMLQVEAGCLGDHALFRDVEVERLRWFLLPSEATRHLTGSSQATPTATHPFQPRSYDSGELLHPLNTPPHAPGKMADTVQACGDKGNGSLNLVIEQQNGTESTQQNVLETAAGGVSRGEHKSGCQSIPADNSGMEWKPKFHHPPKNILKPTIEVCVQCPYMVA